MKINRILLSIAAAAILTASAVGQTRSITVVSEPGAIVWIDDVRYGRTSKEGTLAVATVARGGHTLRVRADGFKETTKALAATQKAEVKVPLTRTEDKAELTYQEAERLSTTDREKAIDAYRQAIKLRPGYTRAYIGLARALSESGDGDGALAAIRDLRKSSPRNAEASAIEGRILKDNGDETKAIAAFKRSIAEGRGFQPEAYTGLGLLYKERAEGFGGQGDIDKETANYNEASKNLRIGLKQLSGAPDASVLYQLVGLVLERQKRYQEAIDLYEEFLRFFPNSSDVPAVQSFIVQLKKQMAEQ
jgi:tetratricopeptide (TPR) repeat protein